MLQVETGEPAGAPLSVPGVSNSGRLIDFLVSAMPPAAAVLATITNVLNLVARRAHREIFRTAEAAVAAACGHDLPAPAGGSPRRSPRS